ncbi:MAG: DUF6051 family protein [Bacteroidales bacterium]|jgi:pimeloyl-ACP methyl ester carboxylesterase|nr:DUF6051 family protein [Bacteroidales bacterium]
MGYTASDREIAARFRAGMTEGEIPGTGVTLSARRFRSCVDSSLPDSRYVPGPFRSLFRSNELEESNREFSYYIMFPRETNRKESAGGNGSGIAAVPGQFTGTVPAESRGRGAIILLHGLNERGWSKYIQWGTRLASGTGRPVVLFPLAYHMNRSPRSWIDRHLMTPLVTARTSLLPDARLSTFVNVALSTRMTVSPQRFMLSGYQTAVDLSALIRLIGEGSISGIAAGGPTDIFAYSIGALVTQVMMLSNPSPLPDDSRIMLFCGGSTFGLMNGTSKLIMDSRAFENLLSFYLCWPDVPMNGSRERLTRLMHDTPEGEAFYAMTSLQRLRDLRGKPFSRYEGRLKAVTLAGDTVIPSPAVRETLSGADTETWEPGYPCTHESPFPVLAGEKGDAVDRTFDRLFDTAAGFLS